MLRQEQHFHSLFVVKNCDALHKSTGISRPTSSIYAQDSWIYLLQKVGI